MNNRRLGAVEVFQLRQPIVHSSRFNLFSRPSRSPVNPVALYPVVGLSLGIATGKTATQSGDKAGALLYNNVKSEDAALLQFHGDVLE